MAEKRKRTDKMVVKDGAVDLNPQRAKRKYFDDEMVNNGTGQLDGKAGMGKKRKRPIPKELKKRKQQRMDEETVSESEADSPKEQKEKKKSRAGAGAKAKTGLYSHDDSDTVSSTSQTWRDEQDDDKDDDRDSASEKDEAEEEPMDCEEAREHTIRDTSIPKSMLRPDGPKTQRGHSTAFRSVEQHITSPHGKPERADFDEADTASLRTADEIRRGERDMPHFSFIKGSESNFSRKSIKKTTGATAHLGHRNIRQRYGKVRFSEESTIPLQMNANIKTGNTYPSSAYTRKNKVEMARTQIVEDKASSSHSCTKSCLRLVLILLVLSVIWTFAAVIPKHELVDNVRAFILQKSDYVDGIMSSLLSSGCQKRKRSDRYDVLEQEKDLVYKRYPNLKESIFTVIAGASFDHVEDSRELVRPVVLFLVGKQGAETKVNDVAASVATMYANVFLLNRPKHDVIHIHGPDHEKYPDDEARNEVYSRVEEGFKNCGNVVLITDVDRLPPCSAILFHGYCDNDGAPYKDAVFIFTVTLETNLPEGADVEKAVQAQLDKAWSRCPEEFSTAKMVAMHSRISNNIVLI